MMPTPSWRKEHGRTWNKNQPSERTVCVCGKEFNDDRGFYVHLGKMEKTSERVKSLVSREKGDSQ